MSTKDTSVDRLSDAQVKELLSLGLEPSQALFEAALNDPSGQQLKTLCQDLELLVLSSEESPLSFQRLTGIEQDELAQFAGKTFLRALASKRTSQKGLESLERYGELISQPGFPEQTRLAGLFIAALARAALHRHFGKPVDQRESKCAHKVFRAIEGMKSAPQPPGESPLADCRQRSAGDTAIE